MKRVFLLVTAALFVLALSACNEQKTLTCVKQDPNDAEKTVEVLKAVYDKERVIEFHEVDENDVYGPISDEVLTSMNEDGIWKIFEGAGHYDLMEKVRESYDTNDVFESDWAEDSEVPEEERLAEEDVVTCTIN